MNTFSNIKELLSTLVREYRLLTEMFEKRKKLAYKYDFALELVEHNEGRIQYLIAHAVLRENGDFLEIDDQFLQFFEQILEVNEEINTASINSNIQYVKENILYYLQENNESRKYDYLRKVKNAIRKIGNVTLRNVIDLKKNTENTFKHEPNYRIKKAKLENLDKKRIDINALIEQTYYLVSDGEQTFFKSAIDEEFHKIITQLKLQLNESKHNLIDIQKEIIEYLNQIKYQSGVIEKLRQVKYLKDQFTLLTDSDIENVLSQKSDMIFESNRSYPLKLSLDMLQTSSEAHDSIKKIAKRIKTKVNIKVPLAGAISREYLEDNVVEEFQLNLEEVRNSFLASSNNLYDFVMAYNFEQSLSFDEKVTVFCQLISQNESSFLLTGEYGTKGEIEYAIVYPK